MISPKVKTLRLYEKIGYYNVFENLILDQWKGDNLGRFYNDLEGAWRAEYMAVSTIEQKLAHDLHHESKELVCHVKKSSFGLEEFLKLKEIEPVSPFEGLRDFKSNLGPNVGGFPIAKFGSPSHKDTNQANVLNFERISNRNSARGS